MDNIVRGGSSPPGRTGKAPESGVHRLRPSGMRDNGVDVPVSASFHRSGWEVRWRDAAGRRRARRFPSEEGSRIRRSAVRGLPRRAAFRHGPPRSQRRRLLVPHRRRHPLAVRLPAQRREPNDRAQLRERRCCPGRLSGSHDWFHRRRHCGGLAALSARAPSRSMRGQPPGCVNRFKGDLPWASRRRRVMTMTARRLALKTTTTKQPLLRNRRWPVPDGSAPRRSTR